MSSNPLIGTSLNAGPLQTAIDLVPVEPDDDTDLPTSGRAFRVQGGGTVRFISGTGTERTTTVADGETLLVQVRRVFDTETTATGIEVYI